MSYVYREIHTIQCIGIDDLRHSAVAAYDWQVSFLQVTFYSRHKSAHYANSHQPSFVFVDVWSLYRP